MKYLSLLVLMLIVTNQASADVCAPEEMKSLAAIVQVKEAAQGEVMQKMFNEVIESQAACEMNVIDLTSSDLVQGICGLMIPVAQIEFTISNVVFSIRQTEKSCRGHIFSLESVSQKAD